MKILLVHGVGHADLDPNYYDVWQSEITAGLKDAGLTTPPEFVPFHYDDLFDQHYRGPGTYAAALTEMFASAAWHWVSDPVTNLFRPSRGFPNPYGDTDLRWKAGMVAQLVVEDELRAELRARLRTVLQGKSGDKPFDVIAAHSLGTLITYDFFRHDETATDVLRNGFYITFGSQINNDFARSRLFPGTLSVPAAVRAWYHLYNDCDPVLTAPIRLSDSRFRQVSTHSEAQHSPVATTAGPGYLDHPNTESVVWPAVALSAAPVVGQIRGIGISTLLVRKLAVKPSRRALLIGINEYPDPANHLEGCVNDVFLMSELLQERGFEADDIRVVLNDRATADAIRERLAWLLYRADDGMERVLFYSGHGAQMPGYNAYEEVDHLNECLVPHDFAWTEQTAITDKDIYRLYSDLPSGARFFAVFDCCHSGGLTRDGSRKVRAIDPPDDIRHRMLRWDAKEKMWRTRALPPLNSEFGGNKSDQKAYMGSTLATYKIGRAMRLRRYMNEKTYDTIRRRSKLLSGPYLPVLLEACGEGEFSYEYRHGVTSYGAFTYSLAKTLRALPEVTFKQAVTAVSKTLHALDYEQSPQLLGPKAILTKPIPGVGPRASSKSTIKRQ